MPSPIARFAFRSPELEVEFEGHPDFIHGQIEFLKDRVGSIVAAAKPGPVPRPAAIAQTAAAATGSASASPANVASVIVKGGSPRPSRPGDNPGHGGNPTSGAETAGNPGALENPTLEQFYRRARSREGRGALQETILIFAYFLKAYREKEEFSIESLNACFSLVGAAPPKSLANTLGMMKRTQKFFAAGSQRGHYTLTAAGTAYVKRLIGA